MTDENENLTDTIKIIFIIINIFGRQYISYLSDSCLSFEKKNSSLVS